MAFKDNTVEIVSTSLLFLAFLSLPSTVTSVDCGGKPFHCENSTHFKICVDFGNGVSNTVDDFVIPCPPGTECQGKNHFECEFLPPTTPAAIPLPSEVPTDGKSKDERSLPTSVWEIVTTNLPTGSSHDKEFSEKLLSTEEHLTSADKSATAVFPAEEINVTSITTTVITTETKIYSEVNQTTVSDETITQIATEKTFESVIFDNDVTASTTSQPDITTIVSSTTINKLDTTSLNTEETTTILKTEETTTILKTEESTTILNTEETTTDMKFIDKSTPSEIVTSNLPDNTVKSVIKTHSKIDILNNDVLFIDSMSDITESQKSTTQNEDSYASSTSWETSYTSTTDGTVGVDSTTDQFSDMNPRPKTNFEITTSDIVSESNLLRTTVPDSANYDIKVERESNNSIFLIIIPEEYDSTALDVDNNNDSFNSIGMEVAFDHGLTVELDKSNLNEAIDLNDSFITINNSDIKTTTTTYLEDKSTETIGGDTSTSATMTAITDELILTTTNYNDVIHNPSTVANNMYEITQLTTQTEIPLTSISDQLSVDENLPEKVHLDNIVNLKSEISSIIPENTSNERNTIKNSFTSDSEQEYHLLIIGLGINPFLDLVRESTTDDIQQSTESVTIPVGGTNNDYNNDHFAGSVTRPLSDNGTNLTSSNLPEPVNQISEKQDKSETKTTVIDEKTNKTLKSNQSQKQGEDENINQLLNIIVLPVSHYLNVLPHTNMQTIKSKKETNIKEITTENSVDYTVRQKKHTIVDDKLPYDEMNPKQALEPTFSKTENDQNTIKENESQNIYIAGGNVHVLNVVKSEFNLSDIVIIDLHDKKQTVTPGTSSNIQNETIIINMPTKQKDIPNLFATEDEEFISADTNNTEETELLLVDSPVVQITSIKEDVINKDYQKSIIKNHGVNDNESSKMGFFIENKQSDTTEATLTATQPIMYREDIVLNLLAIPQVVALENKLTTQLYTRYPTYTPSNDAVTSMYEKNTGSLDNPIETSIKTQVKDNLKSDVNGSLTIFLDKYNITKINTTTLEENKALPIFQEKTKGSISNTDTNIHTYLTDKSYAFGNLEKNMDVNKPIASEFPPSSTQSVSVQEVANKSSGIVDSNINDDVYSETQTNKKKSNITEIKNIYSNIRGSANKTTSFGNTSYNCTNMIRGRYPDRSDCRKFYICIDKQTIVGYCPINTVFSKIKKQCTKNLTHCSNQSEFRCQMPGRFSDYLTENIYYICVQNGQSFVRFKFQCQRGFYLNKESVKCVPNVEILNVSQSLSSDNVSKKDSYQVVNKKKSKENNNSKGTTEKDNENSEAEEALERLQESQADETRNKKKDVKNKRPRDSTESKKSNRCVEEGKFPHHNDCRKYYICYKNKKSVLRRKRSKCDSDEVFNNDKKKCVDADSYECQL